MVDALTNGEHQRQARSTVIPLLNSLTREDRTLAELELATREGALVTIAKELETRRRLLDAAERRITGGNTSTASVARRSAGEEQEEEQQPEQRVLRESLGFIVERHRRRAAEATAEARPRRPWWRWLPGAGRWA